MFQIAPLPNIINQDQDKAALRSRRISILLDFLLPILILGLGTALIRFYNLDLKWGARFFDAAGMWLGKKIPAFDLIYDYGKLPALLTAIAGLGVCITGFALPRLKQWRRSSLFLVLAMLLGPGLLVNAVLKEYWGRPRPRNVAEFNGRYAFEEPLKIDLSSPGQSFPSGHASMGFYFFTLHFLTRKRNRRTAAWLFLLGLAYGVAMGIVRMAQGGHFASYVLWSGGLTWLVCAALYYLMRLDKTPGLANIDKEAL